MSVERKYCYGPDRCTAMAGTEGERSNFSSWTTCSQTCGGGTQWRVVACQTQHCLTTTKTEERSCNTQPCDGTWTCWSDWSPCQGEGSSRRRDRSCQTPSGGSAVCSGGLGVQEVPCSQQHSQCEGERATPLQAGTNVNMIVGGCVLGFILGGLLGAGLVYYYLKVKKNGGLSPPHYISAKSQNLYVSLPMLDLNKHKQLANTHSEYNSGTLRSNTGTLRSSKNGSSIYGTKHGDYETATIKRSHSRRDSSLINNSTIRADLDSDTMFT